MNKKNFIIGIGLALIFFLIYSFNLHSSYRFDNDFARDLSDIFDITKGDLRLIGPKSSFGGIYNGPFYYYIFAPIFLIFHYSIDSILYFNAALFALALAFLFYKMRLQIALFESILIVVSIGLLPFYVLSSRLPGNAFSYLPLLLIFITYAVFTKLYSIRKLLAIGFLGGVIVNFHMANLIPIVLIASYIFIFLEQKKTILFLIIGIGSSFIPLVLFEVKHNFVMLKNTFIDKSYKNFVEDNNLGGNYKNNSLDKQLIFILHQIKSYIIIHPLIIAVVGLILTYKSKLDRRYSILFVIALINMIILVAILRFQFASYYLFPSLLLFIFSFLLLLHPFKILLIFFITAELYFFPMYVFSSSTRPASYFEKRVNYVIAHKLITKDSLFNIIQLRSETAITPLGYEYRYFFKKNGYMPQSESAYNNSDTLLIFSENKNTNLSSLHSWEVEQFGDLTKYKSTLYKDNGVDLYVISK